MIPGSEHAFTFKTLGDALLLRTHIIERFERADVEQDPQRKRSLLTLVIIGAGLVGVELFGELTAFADAIAPLYKHVDRREVRFILLQGGDRIMPEIDPRLADYGARVLGKRPGADIRTNALVRAIEPGKVHLPNETIEAETIVLAAGIVPCPVAAALPVAKDKRGHIAVDATMQCKEHPEVWAIGDCAQIMAPEGKPYPNLAQHALREAKVMARNIVGALDGQPPQPFVYSTKGMMGSLGHGRAFGQMMSLRVRGVPAWFVRRTYYLLQMPGWSRRLGIMIDWAFALLFRPDVVKISLESEAALVLSEAAADGYPAKLSLAAQPARTGSGTDGDSHVGRPISSKLDLPPSPSPPRKGEGAGRVKIRRCSGRQAASSARLPPRCDRQSREPTLTFLLPPPCGEGWGGGLPAGVMAGEWADRRFLRPVWLASVRRYNLC